MAIEPMTPVKAIEKSKRARQAQLIIEQAMGNNHAIRYESVNVGDYKWWITACAGIPDNKQLTDAVRLRLLSTTDIRFVGLWQQVCAFLENGCRAECMLFVDRFFENHISNFCHDGFNVGVFHKAILATVHPYKFNDTKLSEVL